LTYCIGHTPFYLALGFKTTLPIELELSSLHIVVCHGMKDEKATTIHPLALEKLVESKQATLKNYKALQKRRKAQHCREAKMNSF